jgi:GNAT superfamily N-acetyltransferase
MESVKVREMVAAEAPLVADLVARVFAEHVAPLYGPEGVAEFQRYASSAALGVRMASGHLVLVAEAGSGHIVGAAEVREARHLSMFFVESASQKRGVGKELLAAIIRRCREARPDLEELTVHASPNSVSA